MNLQRLQPMVWLANKPLFQICIGLAIIILLSNLGALIDAILHPEIPYFDKEHLIVGAVTAFVSAVLLGLIALYVRYLEQALNEIKTLKDYVERSRDELEKRVAERTKELHQTKERLAHIISSNPAVIYTAKPDGDYGATFISDNVTTQFGYETGEVLEDSSFWVSHIHPEDAPRIFAEMSPLLSPSGNGRKTLAFQAKTLVGPQGRSREASDSTEGLLSDS